ncbi:MAG TPA: DUF308 domain-containing protein [Actinomycetes bacterium]
MVSETVGGSSGDPGDVLEAVGRSWGWLLMLGVFTLLFGVVLLVWPGKTLVVIAVFLGFYLLLSGIFQIVAGFATTGLDGGMRALAIVAGIVSVLLGLFAFRSIAHSVVLLVLLIGFGWLFRGLVRVISAIADKTTVARGWQIAEGLLGALAGVVILVWPAPSLQVLAWISGIILLLLGLIEVVAAFKVRRLA